MIKNFIEFMKEKGMSKNTYESYYRDVSLFDRYFEDSYGEKLVKLVNADVKMYVEYLKKQNIAYSTINRKIASLKIYNEFLVSKDIQKDIIIRAKDYIKINTSLIQKKLPTEEEINRLKHFSAIDEKNGVRDYCLLLLLIYCGLRESEIINLRIIDIKLNDKFINIIGKGNKFRQVVINSITYDALENYLEERVSLKTDNQYLFYGQKNKYCNIPVSRNFVNRLIDKYKNICNIEELHPHLLRSYFCSNALHNAGYTIEQVANQAGHNSLNTTKTYLVTKKEDLVALANKL